MPLSGNKAPRVGCLNKINTDIHFSYGLFPCCQECTARLHSTAWKYFIYRRRLVNYITHLVARIDVILLRIVQSDLANNQKT